jgi:hypothetical protein
MVKSKETPAPAAAHLSETRGPISNRRCENLSTLITYP